MPLGKQFAQELAAALRLRRIQQGITMLTAAEADIARLGPDTPEAASLLLLMAQWVDAGYRDYRVLEPLLARFPAACRKRLPMDDYIRLRMVDSFVDLAKGDLDAAIDTLDLVLKTYQDIPDQEQEALVHFWKGRMHRKKGEYDASLKHIVRARELARDRDKFFTAIIQIQESWLLFQNGMGKEAEQVLDRAESILISSDHYVALANIESARGRIVRRSGDYSKALDHFSRAIEIYERRDPNHVNLARTLVNAAYVRRLLALQMRKRIDTQAHSGRARAGTAPKDVPTTRENPITRYQRIWQQAVDGLTRAREIYALHAHFDGIGKVLLNLGYLHLDSGDIDRAGNEATEAYRIGTEQNDHILMARARILETAIENAHVEEQTGEDVDVAVHASRARQYGEEAQTLAQSTQNRRLLAGACIARGMTSANDFFQEWETARRYATQATGLIGPGERDHLVEDLASLKARIIQASGINDTLRSWSEGIVGNKTFQQITEEFAEIVIPKVWMREEQKISRVAASLSISPKKVRRILRNSGSSRKS
ncbi:MAG TPA: tetratricopeptide repeat protein [Terracidiphilus sp.]